MQLWRRLEVPGIPLPGGQYSIPLPHHRPFVKILRSVDRSGMSLSGRVSSVVGVILVGFLWSTLLTSDTVAQDRGVPQFGPPIMPDTVVAGPFDRGRIWSFADPPLDYFESAYGIRADERGLRHARLATVRLPDCSGALVSPRGLVLTAARCVRPLLPSATRDTSFLTAAPSQDRPVPDLYAERVVQIEEVTARVDSLQEMAENRSPSSERGVVQQRLAQDSGPDERVEVVREGEGRYVAYTYRRYPDVRLAFVADPEVQVVGDLGNMLSYPQHTWDVAVLRIYEDGRPLQVDQHFELGEQGARPGDPVFAVAHPRETKREETAAQIAFRGDVVLPARRSVLRTHATALRAFVDTSDGLKTRWATQVERDQQQLQSLRARIQALRTDYFTARLEERDRTVRQRLSTDSARTRTWSESKNRIDDLLSEKRSLAEAYRAFAFLQHPEYASSTLRRAVIGYEARRGDGEETNLEQRLRSVASQPPAVDRRLLDAHLASLRSRPGADSLAVVRNPKEIVEQSVFADSAAAASALAQGDVPKDDPALQLVEAFHREYRAFVKAWTDLREEERSLTDRLAVLRAHASDHPVVLPNARTPRLTDGRIQGYPYNGTLAPPFTTFFGLFARYHSLQPEWRLPDAWTRSASSMDRSTPLTTAASTDVGAEGAGGPLLNTSLQLVGVIVDGNAQSAAGTYLFLPDRMRTVAADVRGILEGLSTVYKADDLVEEMTAPSPTP